MSVRLSYPSCNTHFSLDAAPADRRATCPRCGDAFPVRAGGSEESGAGSEEPEVGGQRSEVSGAPAAAPASTPHSSPPTPHSKGLSPLRAVLIALSLGLIGLAAGLAVYYTRSKPKPELLPQPVVAIANATPPAQLVGLGYLPAECNVVLAVQPGPIMAYADRTKQDPRELLARAGVPQQVLTAFDLAGLPLAQIDHLAGGAFIGNEGDELRVALVLVLKQPLPNEEQFLLALKAKPMLPKQARWSVTPGNFPLILAKVSPTAWAFGLAERDLSAVDRGGFGPGGTQFRGSETEGVRKMITSVPPDAAAWAVADDDRDWTQKPLVKLAAQSKEVKPWLPVLKEGRGGLVAIRFGESPRLRLFVRAADAATGERVRAYFQARAAEMEGATAGGGGSFALFDAPFDPATTGPLLRRMLDDAKK
jgi:hypothetical protein